MPKPKTNNVYNFTQSILFKSKYGAFGANLFPFEMLHSALDTDQQTSLNAERTHVIDESEM